MVKTSNELDEYFLLDIVLVFLMINYSLPLATIYLGMVLVGSIMYYAGFDSGSVSWIPFVKKKGTGLIGVGLGIAAGVGFIYLYQWLGSLTPMANVFATTAFGESESIGKIVFGVLIAIAETRFFFRTIVQWFAMKKGMVNPFSFEGIKIITAFSAIFTIFHATSKGINNTIDLIATFLFAAISIGIILSTGQWIEAAIMHITVNSHAVGLFDFILKGTLLSSPYLIAGIIGVLYLLSRNRKGVPFLT